MYPDDIDPESGCRLPLPRREKLNAEAQAVYDRLADPAGGTLRGLRGPGGIQLHKPGAVAPFAAAQQLFALPGWVERPRARAGDPRDRTRAGQPVEWAAHEDAALREGISKKAIDIIRFRRSLDNLCDIDAIVIQLAREIFGNRIVCQETFAQALKQFGQRRLVDLVALRGNYAATAALLTAFDMQLDPGQEPGLPVP